MPIGKLLNVDLWAPGDHEGSEYPREIVDKLISNFRELSVGKDAYLPVPLVVGHGEDQKLLKETGIPAAGWLNSVDQRRDIDGRDVLTGSFDLIPDTVADWIAAKQYRRVSIEFYPNFKDHTGREYGPTIRRVALCGGAPPKVKGMRDLPFVTFAEQLSKVLNFEVNAMDRASLIAGLQQLGMDVSLISDAVPDTVLNEMLRLVTSKAMQMPTAGMPSQVNPATPTQPVQPVPTEPIAPAPETATEPDQVPPSEPAPEPKDDEGAAPAPAEPKEDEEEEMKTFTELTKVIGELTSVVKSLQTDVNTIKAGYANDVKTTKRQRIEAFCEQMVKTGRLQPVEVNPPKQGNVQPPSIIDVLMSLPDSDRVHKFSEGSAPMSTLESNMKLIEMRQPYLSFTEKLAQPDSREQVSEERTTQLLQESVLGRSILAQKKKNA